MSDLLQAIILTKPIEAHGEQVTEITLDKPTTGDLMDLGDAWVIGVDESVMFKNDVIGNYISKLGKIPLSSVRELSQPDFITLKAVVIGFLGGLAV
jgi:hypothetical protein